ncbi:MAG: hypothetical protein WD572_06510 [Gammaproteobacteria bacterium]
MQDLDFCKQLLDLTDPWQVEAVEVDTPSRRLDIYIGYTGTRKKGLFGGGSENVRCPDCNTPLPKTGDYTAVSLRHLPIFGLRTFLHVPPSDAVQCDRADCSCQHDWAEAGSKITHQLHDLVKEALQHARSNQAAAKLTGLSSAEVREISELSGISPGGGETSIDHEQVKQDFAAQSYEIADTGRVPAASHPGWQRLIRGDIAITTDSVALRMLLQRVRSDLEKHPGAASQSKGAQILRQFFIKNQQLLQHEIELLQSQAGGSQARSEHLSSTGSGVPPEQHPIWEQLIQGSVKLDTQVVGLQMMLERVRQSIERNPSAASKTAGIKILRQFFGKHQNRLSHEIQQLHGGGQTAGAGSKAAGSENLPGPTDPVWQKLIAGDIAIESDAVSLKMLLERIRQAVKKNPSTGNRIAGAKILRQYFQKNRHRHGAELQQLGVAATAHASPTAAANGSAALPAENDPNWQRLINGEIKLQTSVVSLQMLLERIRQAITKNPSSGNRVAGAKILRQYFAKNASKHVAEIEAIRSGGVTAITAAADHHIDSSSEQVPAISHPSWQRLINGELQITTDAVGLKMMLERIRQSIENNPSEAVRLAGAKILRQYFLKHQNKHQAELNQLRAA